MNSLLEVHYNPTNPHRLDSARSYPGTVARPISSMRRQALPPLLSTTNPISNLMHSHSLMNHRETTINKYFSL
ncbi:hypothetical protein ACH3XW_34220 [Acanthocheilonema viteae]